MTDSPGAPSPDRPPERRRAIRSYVIREGRITPAQQRALSELMPKYGTNCDALADPIALFGSRAPLFLEIGIGNGDNLVAAAARHPGANFLGCDVHRPGLGHALLNAAAGDVSNLRLLNVDGIDLLRALPPGVLDGVRVFFPDPWPKKRHHKRRLLNDTMLALVHSRCKPHGMLQFASDDADYAHGVCAALEASPDWINLAGNACWAPRPHERIVTRFEARARAAAREVFDLAAAPRSR